MSSSGAQIRQRVIEWTDENVETLRRGHAEGLSARQIANQLGGGVTRSAVIGKLYRLGLHRDKPAAPAKPAASMLKPPASPYRNATSGSKRAAKAPKAPKPPVEVALPVRKNAWVPLPGSQPVTIMGLRNSSCRWPVELQGETEMHFCAERAAGGPYCATHEQLAKPAQAAEKARALDVSHARQIFGKAA